MSTRLLLVRHGEIAANIKRRWHGSTDGDLTERGQYESRRLAAYLAAKRPGTAAVYTSPLLRARSTATAIATALGVPLIVEPGLAEYAIGILENETYADLAARHRFFEQADADLGWAPSGGESLAGVGARVVAAWRAIARQHRDAEIIVVSHGAAIAIGLTMLLHDGPRGWPRYRVRNASVSEIVLDPPPRLLTLDVTEHLE